MTVAMFATAILAATIEPFVGFVSCARAPNKKRVKCVRAVFRGTAPLVAVFLLCAIIAWHRNAPVAWPVIAIAVGLFLLGWLDEWGYELEHQLRRATGGRIRVPFSGHQAASYYERNAPVGMALKIIGVALLCAAPEALIAGVVVWGMELRLWARQSFFLESADKWTWPHKARIVLARVGALWPRLLGIVMVGAATALVARSLPLQANQETARVLYGILLQVDVALLVLCMTAIFILTQMVVSAHSAQSAPVVLHSPTAWLPTVLFGTSASLAFAGLSRLDAQFPPGVTSSSLLLEGGVGVAILGLVAAFRLAFKAPLLLRAETVVRHATRGLTPAWIARVETAYHGRTQVDTLWSADDPLVPVGSVLAHCAEGGDELSFVQCLRVLASRLDRIIHPDQVAPVDWYLARHLARAVNSAARLQQAEILNTVCAFATESCTPSEQEVLQLAARNLGREPGGELLLRQVLEAALANGVTEPCWRAARQIGERATKLVGCLPKDEETFLFRDSQEWESMTQQEKDAAYEADWRVETVRDGQVSYLGRVGVQAVEAGLAEVARHVDISLGFLLAAVWRVRGGGRVTWSLSLAILLALESVSEAATARGNHDVIRLHGLDDAIRKMDPAADVGVARFFAHWLSELLRVAEIRRCLSYSVAEGVCMAGLALAECFPAESIALATGIADCVTSTNSRQGQDTDSETRAALHEMRARLKQFTHVCKDKASRDEILRQLARLSDE